MYDEANIDHTNGNRKIVRKDCKPSMDPNEGIENSFA